MEQRELGIWSPIARTKSMMMMMIVGARECVNYNAALMAGWLAGNLGGKLNPSRDLWLYPRWIGPEIERSRAKTRELALDSARRSASESKRRAIGFGDYPARDRQSWLALK